MFPHCSLFCFFGEICLHGNHYYRRYGLKLYSTSDLKPRTSLVRESFEGGVLRNIPLTNANERQISPTVQ